MKILSLYGPQQAGKSEAAKVIAATPGWVRCSFADPLYAMMSALLGQDARQIDKTQPLPQLCGKTLRYALQRLGTEYGRGMIGDTIWLKAMEDRIHQAYRSGAEGVVIDDLRFTNEYLLLRSYTEAEIIRVGRPGVCCQSLNSHDSERDWVDFKWDHNFVNEGTVEQWQEFWVEKMKGY